jgi:uncharacterized protein (DUF1330 family)
MTVYVLAQLSFTHRAAYNRYQDQFMDVFCRFEGRLLAADEHPNVIEGRWRGEKVVLLSFPDENAFRKIYDAPEYQAIAKDRNEGADTLLLLIKGATKER